MSDDLNSSNADGSNSSTIPITVTHRNVCYTFDFDPSATITDLCATVETDLAIPPCTQKFLIPKHGLQKPPFKDPNLPLAPLRNVKIQLLAPPTSELSSFQAASTFAAKRAHARAQARKHPVAARPTPTISGTSKTTSSSRAAQDAQYTFLTLRPLPFLPHPDKSLSLLERLKSDPGIRSAMRTHKFSVNLLTEMEPLSNTSSSHEGTSRILGLNRNKGEVIELRLRTDAHDGYRDYKTIRKTLCHELAHNIHSDHDRKFWDLCKQIEREVDAGASGHTISTDDSYSYAPARGSAEDEDYPEDHGGWQGGEFVVGGGSTDSKALSRREILARAAEERMKKMNMETPDGGKPDSGMS